MSQHKRLNFMLLQCEDIGRHFGCYGQSFASTPNVDRLAAEGALFTNAFTHSPVCGPSRGGMVTGRYPYSLGNHQMRSKLAVKPGLFTEELRKAGYFVNWSTKLDFNFDPGEEWRDASDAWANNPAPEQPFFLYENFGITHESRMFPEIPDWHGPLPPEAAEGKRHRPEDMRPPPWLTDCPELREQMVKYFDALSILDAQVGNRLRWLDEQGLRDNTVVILLSDHGRGLPREKRWCYDAGMHLPLIVRWPGEIEPGSVREDLVAWVDIAPTLLSLAGAEIPETYQGQVFLGHQSAAPRECVFGGRDRMDKVFDRVRMVRDTRWHYIRNYFPDLPWAQCQNYMEQQNVMKVMRSKWKEGKLSGDDAVFFAERKPPEELFDAVADPDCLHNLAADPAHRDVLECMRSRLDAHLDEVEDLGRISEEELIERGILTNRLLEYRDSRPVLHPEDHPGPRPIPMTLREVMRIDILR